MPMTSEPPSLSIAGPSATRSSRNGLRPFQGHDAIYAICYSPDGTQIATGGRDPRIRLWDSSTGKMLINIDTPDYLDTVRLLCYSPDGKRLVSGDWHNRIRIWSVTNGKLILERVKAHLAVLAIVYSPNGQHIASGGIDGRVRIWHAKDLTEMIEFPQHPGHVGSVSFSPDGYRLATGCRDSKVRIFDIVTGTLVVPPLEGHTDVVRTVVYSPNGLQLASGSADCTIRVWNALTGEMVLGPLEGHFNLVCCLVYSPDGGQLVSSSLDNTIRVWDSDTGVLIGGPVKGHRINGTAVSFAPNGTRFITGASDGSMRVWDARTCEIVFPELTENEKERYQLTGPFRGHTRGITAVAYFPDGGCVASASDDGSIRIWDVHTGEQVGRPLIARDCGSIAISSDGSRLVSGGTDIRVWDSRSGHLVLEPFQVHSLDLVSCVQFSPDDQLIASSDWGGHISLWDSQTGKQLRSVEAHFSGWINTLAFSTGGRLFAGGGNTKSIRIWDVLTMNMVTHPFKGHTDWVHPVAFSPDGLRITSGSDNGSVRILDAKTGMLLLAPPSAHSGGVTSVSYSPDGTRICSTSDDGTICLWHAATGHLVLGPLGGHKGAILSAVFSPDGKHIVTGSDDCTIKFWDVATGKIMQLPKCAPEMSATHFRLIHGSLTSGQPALDDADLAQSLDSFYNHFLQSPRDTCAQQAQGTIVNNSYARALSPVFRSQLFRAEINDAENEPSIQHAPSSLLPVSGPSNTTTVDFSSIFGGSTSPSEMQLMIDKRVREMITYLKSKGWHMTFTMNPIAGVGPPSPTAVPSTALPSSSSNAVDTAVDDTRCLAASVVEMTVMPSLEIDPSTDDETPRKAHKIEKIRGLLTDMLQKIDFPVKQRRFPWSTLKDEVERHGYSVVNWPRRVPRLKDKGIYSLTVTQADTLYRALTQPNESDRVRFEPRTEDSAPSGSLTQETARPKRPVDSEDYMEGTKSQGSRS